MATYTPFRILRYWTLRNPPVLLRYWNEILNDIYNIRIPVGREKGQSRTVVLGICPFFSRTTIGCLDETLEYTSLPRHPVSGRK